MNRKPSAPAVEIKLRVLSPDQAKLSGYKAIANPVDRKTEAAIFASMEAGMAGSDAVWITQGNGKYSLARRASELWTGS